MVRDKPSSTPTSTGHSLAPPLDPPEDRRLKAAGLLLLGLTAGTLVWIAETFDALWPLDTDVLVRLGLASFVVLNSALLGLQFMAAGCGAARPLYHPGRRRALGLQLLLANLLVPALALGLLGDHPAARATFQASGADVALGLVGTLLIVGAWRLWRRSRKHEALGADEAMARDPRPPVLYLRSFRDDGDALIDDSGFALPRRLMKALALPTPEQELADLMGRVPPGWGRRRAPSRVRQDR